ncbi:uncharacterized protein LOC141679962 [Apium graveolens]|uniref:uncharacterized protein LOC141679962 n=1 Tax=Apium graveolens TaxID=4045 RepID=UPI003D7B688A
MTWEEFETLFNEKFYSEAMLSAKVNEFSRLYQGSLSVAEYARKFDRLAKFAPDLVSTEASRVNRFREGLQPKLARDVDIGRTGSLTYSQAVEKALRAEYREQKIMKVKGSTTMPRGDVQFNRDQNRFSNKIIGQGLQNRFDPNKRFKGDQRNKQAGLQPWPQYSGATHSFAFVNYLKRISRPFERLPIEFSAILPSGEILYSNKWLRAVPIYIDNHELYVDLVVLEMHDYEVILGMDWLSKYNATIDCKNKKVMFNPSEGDQFEFVANFSNYMISTISAIKDRRMLQDGCVGYFGNVIGTDIIVENKPEEVPVVKEFLEVFPKELPGLPPDREIQFEIDLIPSTDPISKAPYRMAPAELRELKSQLHELLEKKLVRPSYSP